MTRLKEIRKSLKLSQEQMAHLLHISRRTYGLYERGEQLPGSRARTEMARVLNILPEQLCEEAQDLPVIPRSAEEEELLRIYRSLDPVGKEYVFQVLQNEESLAELYQERRSPLGR